jgi:hypothetical protein
MSPTSNRVYVGAQYLYKSEDRAVTWERISPDLTTNDPAKQQQAESGGLTVDNSTAENHTTISCISESAMDKNLIWVGTDDGNLQVTRDGGQNWINTSGNIPDLPPNTWCSSVYPSRFEKGTAYATFDGHRNDDMKPYVFKTTDYGNTWIGLADENITAYCYKVLEDLENPNLLFLGTEFGLFVSVDGGSSWAQFKGELPNVSVMDMVIHPREHDLVLGTHGRGVYIIDDITPLRQLSREVLDAEFAFIESRPAIPMIISGPQWSGLDDEFRGSNPASAIPVTFYMKKRHIFGKMSIEIFDKQGKRLAELAHVSRKGVNRAYWIPSLKPARAPRTDAIPFQMMFAFGGPSYPPGKYNVVVTKGKNVYESEIEILLNPKSKHTDADRDIRMQTIMKGYNLLEDMAYTDRKMNDAITATAGLADSDKIKSSAKKKILAMNAEFEGIKDRMMVRNFGDLRGDSKLRENLGFLYGSMMMYPGRPTNSQIRRMDDLGLKVAAIDKEVEAVFDTYLESINTQLEKAEMEKIQITSREEFNSEK